MLLINMRTVIKIMSKECLGIKAFLNKANCSEAVWRSISKNKPIRISTAGKLAKALDVAVEDLLIE